MTKADKRAAHKADKRNNLKPDKRDTATGAFSFFIVGYGIVGSSKIKAA